MVVLHFLCHVNAGVISSPLLKKHCNSHLVALFHRCKHNFTPVSAPWTVLKKLSYLVLHGFKTGVENVMDADILLEKC